MSDNNLFARGSQILQHVAVIRVENYGARRNSNDEILGAAAVAIGAAAVLAATGSPLLAMREGRQAIDARLSDHDDTSAVASISAIRTTARHILLTAKAHATVATPACF